MAKIEPGGGANNNTLADGVGALLILVFKEIVESIRPIKQLLAFSAWRPKYSWRWVPLQELGFRTGVNARKAMKSSSIPQKIAACLTASIFVGLIAQAKERWEESENCLIMKDGTMMVLKNGKSTPMKKEMDMPNGRKVMPDGTIVLQNGSRKMMRDGQAMGMDGVLLNSRKRD